MSDKKWAIPQDIQDVWIQHVALDGLRDRYIKIRWLGYKLAKKAAIESQRKRKEFWRKVEQLYPELGTNIQYDANAGVVTKIKSDDG